jgi:hypothetical protein
MVHLLLANEEEPVMSAAACLPLPEVPRVAAAVNLTRARREFQALEAWLMSKESRQLPLHDLEREQERRGREIQRLLLQAHIAQRGTGDVGPAVEVRAADDTGTGELHTYRRLDPCHPQTIFGAITVERTGYCRPGAATVHLLDDQLQLPHRSFSYELQRRLVQAAVQGPFDEATARVVEATGVMIPKRSAEQLVQEAARDFEAFYRTRTPPPGAATGAILAAALDGKGVPMVKAEPTGRVMRRGKGEKVHQKKMAVVATVYTQHPRVRSPQEVFESLFGLGPPPGPSAREPAPTRERPEYKRVWASLLKGKAGIMAEVVEEMRHRDPGRQKYWVVLTDGERALQQSVKRRLRGVPLVLDFQHVLAKLWSAAYAFHEEGSPKALAWVQERAWRLLHGEVSQVVQGMRLSATKRQLRSQKRKVVEGAAAYFYRNRRHMRYDEYLRQGWPIATGVVEGACKNLVKDRMERSGMRWTPAMAEAMLKVRAVYLSGDFESYWGFHVTREHERLHPPGSWRPLHIIEEK